MSASRAGWLDVNRRVYSSLRHELGLPDTVRVFSRIGLGTGDLHRRTPRVLRPLDDGRVPAGGLAEK